MRLGSSAVTTRGFGTEEFAQIGDWITEVLDGLARHGAQGNGKVEAGVREAVAALCRRHPIYAPVLN